MTVMTPKERLEAVLQHGAVDRPPVICPGGMMNAAVVEVMERTGYGFPAVHRSVELMAGLAIEVHEKTGFENIGLPFCMTVEAESMGSRVNIGSPSCEPKIEREAYPSVEDVPLDGGISRISSDRAAVVLSAIDRVSRMRPSVPVTGVVTGPLSAAASIVDPVAFFKELRKNRVKAHRVLAYATGAIATFAKQMLEAGASSITVADPSASGEILGPTLFEEYGVRYLNEIIDAIHTAGGLVIVHICGDLKSVTRHLRSIRADALSMDSMMNLARIKRDLTGITTMGNVSTQLLGTGSPGRIGSAAERLVREGVDIIAPACGLDMHTPLKSIRALTDSVRACAS